MIGGEPAEIDGGKAEIEKFEFGNSLEINRSGRRNIMITSTANKNVKYVISLMKKSKLRYEDKVFVAEGIRMVREADEKLLKAIYMSESFLKSLEDGFEGKSGLKHMNEDTRLETKEFFERFKNITEIVDDKVFEVMSGTVTPQGILAVIGMPEYDFESILKKENVRLVVLEDLQDPGNLGTVMRTGEGAGIDGVIMTDNTVDIYNPKCVRATMGSLFRVPHIYVGEGINILKMLKNAGITTFGLALEGASLYDEEDLTGRCAFFVGNEGNGLRKETVEECDRLIKIPMEGKLESLNAGISAAVVMYESLSQTRRKGKL